MVVTMLLVGGCIADLPGVSDLSAAAATDEDASSADPRSACKC